MVRLKYIGRHQVHEIIDVNEAKAKILLARDDYKCLEEDQENKPKKEKITEPNETWKEKDIKKWIKDNKINVRYDIVNDTKKDIILRLKDIGAI